MNPARSLGPDIVSTDFTGWWIYIIGPVTGAIIAAMVITLVRGGPGMADLEAAEGGDLPIQGGPSGDGSSPAGVASDS
jgi:aquaporin Z